METIINPEDFNAVVRRRRSIFPQDYTGEKVRDEVVVQILENARWAPTHKLTEPWRFLVFAGEGLNAFAKFQSDLYKEVTELDGTFQESKYQNLLTKPLLSSHIIAVIMKRDARKSVPEAEEIGAVFCAIQNMYLTVTAYGLGGYLSTGGVTYFKEAKPYFELEEHDRIIGFFHIGVPKKEYPSSRRKPLDDVCEWITTA